MKTEFNYDDPHISLKFGGIKGGNFADNPEALELLSNNAPDIEVIKSFNGKFYLWWEQRYTDKQGAINYIIDYVHATYPPSTSKVDMETEINLLDFDAEFKGDGVMLRQGSDMIWLDTSEAIQLRNFLNQLELGEEK